MKAFVLAALGLVAATGAHAQVVHRTVVHRTVVHRTVVHHTHCRLVWIHHRHVRRCA